MLSKSEIQHLKSLRTKKFRQKYNHFVVEGEKAVTELLHSAYTIEHIYCLADWADLHKMELKRHKHSIINKKELERISGFEQPNKVFAVVRIPENTFSEEIFNSPLVIALDFMQDPGNLGTIIRTADWYGITDILCSENCVDVYNPKVINATMGSFARVNVHYVNLETILTKHANNVYACVMNGDSVYSVTPKKNSIILIGNEGKGISEELLAVAKNKISIPKKGKAESLNAAIATAVVVDVLARTRP